MPKVPDFSSISVLELVPDFNIIPNYALAISCRVAVSTFRPSSLIYHMFILLEKFLESVNRKGSRVEVYTFKSIPSFLPEMGQ